VAFFLSLTRLEHLFILYLVSQRVYCSFAACAGFFSAAHYIGLFLFTLFLSVLAEGPQRLILPLRFLEFFCVLDDECLIFPSSPTHVLFLGFCLGFFAAVVSPFK